MVAGLGEGMLLALTLGAATCTCCLVVPFFSGTPISKSMEKSGGKCNTAEKCSEREKGRVSFCDMKKKKKKKKKKCKKEELPPSSIYPELQFSDLGFDKHCEKLPCQPEECEEDAEARKREEEREDNDRDYQWCLREEYFLRRMDKECDPKRREQIEEQYKAALKAFHEEVSFVLDKRRKMEEERLLRTQIELERERLKKIKQAREDFKLQKKENELKRIRDFEQKCLKCCKEDARREIEERCRRRKEDQLRDLEEVRKLNVECRKRCSTEASNKILELENKMKEMDEDDKAYIKGEEETLKRKEEESRKCSGYEGEDWLCVAKCPTDTTEALSSASSGKGHQEPSTAHHQEPPPTSPENENPDDVQTPESSKTGVKKKKSKHKQDKKTGKSSKEHKEGADESKEGKDHKDKRHHKEGKENKGHKEPKEGKDSKESRDKKKDKRWK